MANRKEPRASTPQAREEQLCALAVDAAEQKLRDGTASAQIIVHFLKMSSEKERLERLKLEREVEMLKAKTAALESSTKMDELYKEAIKAMQLYSGYHVDKDYDEY